jgi:GNAT superfamily N-acetyltransferase
MNKTTPMNILVRNITPKDYAQAIEVIKRSNRESLGKIYLPKLIDAFCQKYDLENFQVKAQEIQYFVAENSENSQIVGIIGLKHNELRTFFVDPQFQGKGIGRKLYDRLEAEAKKLNLSELILEGSPLGEPIYIHLGFNKVKTIYKERVGIKYSDSYMKKSLV